MTPPLLWLLGDPTAAWTVALAEALAQQGAHVERIGPSRAAEWLAAGAMPHVAATPQLFILGGDVAFPAQGALMQLLDRAGPWRFLPRVVVTTAEEPDETRLAYQHGAASLVVMNEGVAGGLRRAAEVVARYWVRTVMLPNPDYFAV